MILGWKLRIPVITPSGNAFSPTPHRAISEPHSRCVHVTPPLAVDNLLRKVRKPRPVPRLGHVLVKVNMACNRSESRPDNLTPPVGLLAFTLETRPCKPTIPAKALRLHPVQFPIALMTPGTRLPSCPSRILTRS